MREKEDVERKLLHDIEVNEHRLDECQLRFKEELEKQVQRENRNPWKLPKGSNSLLLRNNLMW